MIFFDGLSFPAAGVIRFGHYRANVPLYYGIQYNSAGSLRMRVNHGKEFRIAGPSCFITHPGAYFEYELKQGERHDFIYFCFIGPRVKEYLEKGLLELMNQPIPISREHKFSATLREALRLRELGRYAETVNLLENLLLQIRNPYKNGACIYQASSLQLLTKRIRANPEQNWNFDEEAKKLNVTTSHFRRIFRKFTGDSPLHYLIQQRLARAANRLVHSDEPISAIAAGVGLENLFYFSHLFKKYYGISPKKYREEFMI